MRLDRRADEAKAKHRVRRLIRDTAGFCSFVGLDDDKTVGRGVSKTRAVLYRCTCERCQKLELKRLEKHHGQEQIRELDRGSH